MNKPEKKAQIAVYDALVAIAIFFMIYMALDSAWNTEMQNLQQTQTQNEMQFRCLQAITVLTQTSGVPFNWEKNPTAASAIGIVSKAGEVKKEKLNALAAMDYSTAQVALMTAPFDFRVEFDAAGTADDLNIGRGIDANATVISMERSTKFNGGNAFVRLKIFN